MNASIKQQHFSNALKKQILSEIEGRLLNMYLPFSQNQNQIISDGALQANESICIRQMLLNSFISAIHSEINL